MPVVIVRCDGSSAIGLGHVSRCLALADELRETHGCAVIFAMRDLASAGVAAVRAAGYAVEDAPTDDRADYGEWLHAFVSSHGAGVLLVDVRDGLSRASLDACRADGVLVATIDDGSERRLASSLTFYPPVPQVEEMEWGGFTGRRYTGWKWVILRREFARQEAHGAQGSSPAEPEPVPCLTCDILVTMGGSDPAGMTEFTIRALDLLDMPLAVGVVVGPAFASAETLIDAIARSRHHVQVSSAPEAMAPLMRSSRLAVSSFGVTSYELAACGVPAAHLCLTDDHARSSSVFEREGIARTVGVMGRVRLRQVAEAVSALLGSAGRRAEMSARAQRLVDGRGAARVAATVVRSIQSRH